jgi:hypothetical protein
VKHGRDARLEDEVIRYCFERLAIDGMALGLWFGDRGTGRLGALFKLNANALTINGLFVSIPGETFNTHGSDVAAEAAETLEQSDADPGPRSSDGSGESGRPATNDQNIGGVDNLNISSGFFYFHYDSL